MKKTVLGIFISLIIISSFVYMARTSHKELDQVSEETSEEIKEERSSTLTQPVETNPETAKMPTLPEKIKKIVAKDPEQQRVSQETEKDFLEMKIPNKFSSSPKERYHQIYTIYLKSSFYLNEVAAENLSTTKEDLSKALRGLAIYFEEMENLQQPDSALAIIERNQSSLFNEALQDLSPSDKALIEEALKIQSEE